MEMNEYLGEVGLILLLIVLLIIFIPIMFGMLIATILEVSGLYYFGVVGLVTILILGIFVLYYCSVL